MTLEEFTQFFEVEKGPEMRDRNFLKAITSMPLEEEPEPVDVSGFLIECRSAIRYNPRWWIRAEELAMEVGRMPCLAFQLEGGDWMVQVYAKDVIPDLAGTNYTVRMKLEAFMLLLSKRDADSRF